MLFRLFENYWLGVYLGMTGKMRVESANFRPGKYDHLILSQVKRALVFAIRGSSDGCEFISAPLNRERRLQLRRDADENKQ